MPTYAYACTACEHRFDIVQSFTDDSLTECPECAGRLRKLFNAVGVVFKGSGFYSNDSRKDAADSRRGAGKGSRNGTGGTGDTAGKGGKEDSGSSGNDHGSSGSASAPAASGGSGGSSADSSSSTAAASAGSAGSTKTAAKTASKSEGTAA